jgi:lysozyme
MTVRGIDVSHHQLTTPSLDGLGFLFARASIGTQPDDKYAMHIANARRAGLLVGAYHFNWSTLSVADQARAFLAAAGDVDFYALDVEGSSPPQFTRAEAAAFIDRVHAAGKPIGLYMSESGFYADVGQDWNWIANWSHRPSRLCLLWQYTGGPIDHDLFDGSLAELRALSARAAPLAQEEPMGLSLRLFSTTDASPFDAFGTAKIKGTNHSIIRVRDMALVGVADGFDLGVVQLGALTSPLEAQRKRPAIAGDRTSIVALNSGGELYVALLADVAFTPLKDPTPFSQAQLDAAKKAATDAANAACAASIDAQVAQRAGAIQARLDTLETAATTAHDTLDAALGATAGLVGAPKETA